MSRFNIKYEYGEITIDRIKDDKYSDEKSQAQLRQKVKLIYPSVVMGNSLNETIYGYDDFDKQNVKCFEEVRIAWIDIPKNVSLQDLNARLSEFKGAVIWKYLSNDVILTDEQKTMIVNGIVSREDIVQKQLIRFPNGHELAGKPVMANGGVYQFKKYFFSREFRKDIDDRVFFTKKEEGLIVELSHKEKEDIILNNLINEL